MPDEICVGKLRNVAAISSPAPLSAVNCSAEGTKFAWPSRPTWLTSSRRLGLRRSPIGPDLQTFWTEELLRDCGRISSATSGGSRVRSGWCAKLGSPLPDAGEDEHDADVAGGRGRSAIHRPVFSRSPLPTSRSITTFRWPRCITIPIRANGQLVPIVPSPLVRSTMTVNEWLCLAHDEEGRGRAAP